MKNKESWKPSKFVYRNGKLAASSAPAEVGAGSRLMVGCIARFYDAHLRKYAAGKLVDLGCGKVPFYEAYKNCISENICVDWPGSPHLNKFWDIQADLNQTLPFADNAFDTIILSDVLEHISEPDNLWREMARILAPGGHLLMNVPYYYWLHEQPHDFYRYTEFALRRFVEKNHLRLVLLESIGGSPEVLADLLAKNCMFIPGVGSVLARIVQGLAALFLKTSFGQKVSRKTSASFPLGYFLIAESQKSPTKQNL